MDNIYQIAVYADRATKRISVTELSSLPSAFRLFNMAAGILIDDLSSCVLLSKKTGDCSGTVLAAKSTDSVHVEIHQAYYELTRGL